MADNIPTPSGAVPPKKETGKVQPKKETVRINLPPKPSAAPTIKLPTLPPGGPTGPSSAGSAPAPSASAPRAQAAPIAQRPASMPAPRTAATPAAATLSPIDKGLAIAAAVVGLIAVGSVIFIMMIPS